jgi:hypothetical protein
MYLMRYFVFICLLVALYGCRQTGSKSGKLTMFGDSIYGSDFLKSELPEIYHRFPSPDEMLQILNKTNLSFRPGLANNASSVQNYLSSKSQALNLGVYAADFAYISAFKRYNESSVYFESIYKLCDNLLISSAFDYTILKRIQNNISNPDSLKTISDLAFNHLNSYLVENGQEKTFAIISIGGFIEALYLSFGLSEDFSKENVMVQYITDQKYVLDNIIAFSKQFSDKEDVKDALELLNPIISVFEKIRVVPQETKVTKTDEGKLIIKGGNKLEISETQYRQLQLATLNVRNQIIKN